MKGNEQQPDSTKEKAMIEKMEALLDKERLLKYRQFKNRNAALLSLGAGVLLRLAAEEYESGALQKADIFSPVFLTASEAVSSVIEREILRGELSREIRYGYNDMGKPFFRDIPIHFSLSHSGSMVLGVFASREVGADIQMVTGLNREGVALRYFSETERRPFDENLQQSEKMDLFYRIWTKKEAYGKLLGCGVAQVLSKELPEKESGLFWKDGHFYKKEEEYYYSICYEKESGV